MRALDALGIAATVAILGGCAESQNTADETAEPAVSERTQLGVAELVRSEGERVGTVVLNQVGETLTLEVAINGLDAGERAFHLHSIGKCDAPDFKSAGGHLNPFDTTHGRLSDGGKHLGDLPNITVGEDGTYSGPIEIESEAPQVVDLIFDEDGTAVMLHAGPDDYRTDPAGAAGPRIACGELVQS